MPVFVTYLVGGVEEKENISGNISIFSLVKGVFQSNRCCEILKCSKGSIYYNFHDLFFFKKKHRYFKGIKMYPQFE